MSPAVKQALETLELFVKSNHMKIDAYRDVAKSLRKALEEDDQISRHDPCPHCYTSELLCGHNGVGCDKDPEKER